MAPREKTTSFGDAALMNDATFERLLDALAEAVTRVESVARVGRQTQHADTQ